jgi:hypothetical protein
MWLRNLRGAPLHHSHISLHMYAMCESLHLIDLLFEKKGSSGANGRGDWPRPFLTRIYLDIIYGPRFLHNGGRFGNDLKYAYLEPSPLPLPPLPSSATSSSSTTTTTTTTTSINEVPTYPMHPTITQVVQRDLISSSSSINWGTKNDNRKPKCVVQ